jgi:hypothetical protein
MGLKYSISRNRANVGDLEKPACARTKTGLRRTSLAKLHDRPVKISTTIHGREKKKKRPEGRFLIQKP